MALLVAVAFWTWLWGPLGLLMATPLTVCLVVVGKHVPGLKFVATLLSDTPALAPEDGDYQRLLARDVGEAADVLDRFVKAEPAKTVYDALLVPALNYAERDRLEDQLGPDDEQAVIEATRELMSDGPLGAALSERWSSGVSPWRPSPTRDCACSATPPTAKAIHSHSRNT